MKTYTLYYNDIIGRLIVGMVINYHAYRPTKPCSLLDEVGVCVVQTGPVQYKYQLELPDENLWVLNDLMQRCSSGEITSFVLCEDMYTNGEAFTGIIKSIRCDTLKGNKSHLVFLEIEEIIGG